MADEHRRAEDVQHEIREVSLRLEEIRRHARSTRNQRERVDAALERVPEPPGQRRLGRLTRELKDALDDMADALDRMVEPGVRRG